MSIIIASLDFENQTVHIGSDRKRMSMLGEPLEGELIKLFKIKPDLYFCVNGHVGNGFALADLLLDKQHLPISSLIDIVSSYEVKRGILYGKLQGDCVFVLAGVDNEGPFIFARYTEGDVNYMVRAKAGETMRAIAAPCDKTSNLVIANFSSSINSGKGHKQSIIDSIQYASTIDNAVGSTYDFISIKKDEKELESAIAMTGTLAVGDTAGDNNAGITGISDEGDESVRFYAGSTFENRNIAPWRVLDNGNMYSTAGYIGGFKILQNSLESANEYGAGKFVLYPDNGYMAFIDNSVGYWAGIGANVFPATAGVRCVGRFDNIGFSGSDNYGISVTAKNGTRNIGIAVEGDIMFQGNSRIRNHAVKTGVVSDGSTFTVTDQGALLFNGSGSAILPASPPDGRTVTVNGIGGTIQIKSPDKIIRDRGDQIAINTYMTGISWGRTFTYFENVNAWICTGYLN